MQVHETIDEKVAAIINTGQKTPGTNNNQHLKGLNGNLKEQLTNPQQQVLEIPGDQTVHTVRQLHLGLGLALDTHYHPGINPDLLSQGGWVQIGLNGSLETVTQTATIVAGSSFKAESISSNKPRKS